MHLKMSENRWPTRSTTAMKHFSEEITPTCTALMVSISHRRVNHKAHVHKVLLCIDIIITVSLSKVVWFIYLFHSRIVRWHTRVNIWNNADEIAPSKMVFEIVTRHSQTLPGHTTCNYFNDLYADQIMPSFKRVHWYQTIFPEHMAHIYYLCSD